MVGIKEMSALISSVTMHSVRIYHEVKLLGFLVESIKKLKGILVVHIIVACAMSDLEHDRLVGGVICRIFLRIIEHL